MERKNISSHNNKEAVKEILNKYPYSYSAEEIASSEHPNDPEDQEELKNKIINYFIELAEKKNEQASRSAVASYTEVKKVIKDKIKVEKEDIFNSLLLQMNSDFVSDVKKRNLYKKLGLEHNFTYWVGYAAGELAEIYFKKINKKATKKELLKIKNEFKSYFYTHEIHKKELPIKSKEKLEEELSQLEEKKTFLENENEDLREEYDKLESSRSTIEISKRIDSNEAEIEKINLLIDKVRKDLNKK